MPVDCAAGGCRRPAQSAARIRLATLRTSETGLLPPWTRPSPVQTSPVDERILGSFETNQRPVPFDERPANRALLLAERIPPPLRASRAAIDSPVCRLDRLDQRVSLRFAHHEVTLVERQPAQDVRPSRLVAAAGPGRSSVRLKVLFKRFF